MKSSQMCVLDRTLFYELIQYIKLNKPGNLPSKRITYKVIKKKIELQLTYVFFKFIYEKKDSQFFLKNKNILKLFLKTASRLRSLISIAIDNIY